MSLYVAKVPGVEPAQVVLRHEQGGRRETEVAGLFLSSGVC
jgi:hypothetical protein